MNKEFDLTSRLRIEVVIDTICPWCYIGKRRLESALQDENITDYTIDWRPFLLNPDMPRDGVDRQIYLATKFGGHGSARRVYDAIAIAGAATGIDFNFDQIATTPNSVDSHRLIRYALNNAPERTDALVEAIFQSFFLDGQNIGDRHVLAAIAASQNFERQEVETYLLSQEDVAAIENENRLVHRLGVSGVPCYILNKRYALSGAQEPEILRRLIPPSGHRSAIDQVNFSLDRAG